MWVTLAMPDRVVKQFGEINGNTGHTLTIRIPGPIRVVADMRLPPLHDPRSWSGGSALGPAVGAQLWSQPMWSMTWWVVPPKFFTL